MAVSLNSVVTFNPSANYQVVKRSNIKAVSLNFSCLTPLRGEAGLRQYTEGKGSRLFPLATTGGNIITETTDEDSKTIQENGSSNNMSTVNSSADVNISKEAAGANSVSQVSEISNASADPANLNQEPSTPKSNPSVKRAPLTARERLRAARVLNRYTESKPSSPALGSKLLEALKETDKGKKRPGLPEAPTNMLDDGKRGLSPGGWDISLPEGMDVYVIAFSFIFISTVMFATTYIVWKVGAIHFNEF